MHVHKRTCTGIHRHMHINMSHIHTIHAHLHTYKNTCTHISTYSIHIPMYMNIHTYIYTHAHQYKNLMWAIKIPTGGFPDGAVVENLPANAGDTGSTPGLGRSPMPRSN